jgi:predicted HD phosphohydrolase
MSFDPDYPTKSLDYFKPLVNEIFSRTPFDPKFVGKAEFE